MPGITKEVRTIMYSVEPTGHVALHKFPFNANDKYGMEKLQRLVKRGFTFADPRKPGSPNTPQVIVTGVVDLTKPVSVEQVDEPATEADLPPEEVEIEQPVTQTATIEPANNGKRCLVCGFVAKSEFGLTVHQRRHRRE